MDASRKA